MKPIYNLPDINPDGLHKLAAAVLKKSVDDEDHMGDYLKFWCDVVNLKHSIFLEKANKKGIV